MSFSDQLDLVLVKEETTNNDPTLALVGSDAVWIKDFSPSLERESVDRSVASAYGQGAPPMPGLTAHAWSGMVELGPYTIAGAGDLPAENVFLRGLGFESTFAAGPPLTQTFELKACTVATLATWWYDIDCPGGADNNLLKLYGGALDGTLSAVPGSPIEFSINAICGKYVGQGNETLVGAVLPPFKPESADSGEASFTIHAPGGDVAFPDRIYSFECVLNRNPITQKGVRGGEGVEGTRQRPTVAPTATVVVDVTSLATLDIRDVIDGTYPTTTEMHFPARAPGVNSVGFIFTGFVGDASIGAQDETKTWSLALKGGWPGTPGTAIGTQPAHGVLKIVYTTTPP